MVITSNVTVSRDGDAVTVIGHDALDLTNSALFHDSMRQASSVVESLTADLTDVTFIDTAVLHDLAQAAVTMIDRGKRLTVNVSAKAYPLRVLRITGILNIMDVVADGSLLTR